ncbi:MAG: MFS transporter [Gammaproteobacteria bacterium]|nr:MFS transporter [Gammaproteobacteria bacterium]
MTEQGHRLPLYEKIGYSLGDAAANLVWRGALAFLAVFYTDTFGIPALAVGVLLLIVRLSDGITDIIMGMIADRTSSRWGKFRPWVLFSAPALGVFMVLTFTTPDIGPMAKLIWAYATYIGLTLAYTVNNVPYSAMMGVMTPSNVERTNLSSWRFAGAFFGGFLVMVGTPLLVAHFGNGNDQTGYQYTMYLFAVILVIMLIITFASTKERVIPTHDHSDNLKQELWDLTKNIPYILIPLTAISLFFYYRNLYSGFFFLIVIALAAFFIKKLLAKSDSEISDTQKDLVDLLTNVPWIVLLIIGFLFMMFNGVKIGATAYYFSHYIGDKINAAEYFGWLPGWLVAGQEILVSAYFAGVLAISVIGALCTGFLAKLFGKKNLFIISLAMGGLILCPIYFLEPDQIYWLFGLGICSEFFAAIMPTLFFSMLGDTADYSEWKNDRRATGLIYSAGTFINKTGGGFAGALILIVLAAYGYNGMDESTISATLPGMKALMSWIPSAFAFAAAVIMLFYPLGDARMKQIESDLGSRRQKHLD